MKTFFFFFANKANVPGSQSLLVCSPLASSFSSPHATGNPSQTQRKASGLSLCELGKKTGCGQAHIV